MYGRGFTFIETIVVVAMMSVMLGSGFVYFSNFSAKQDLDKAKNMLVNQVKIARSYARAGIKPEGQTGSTVFRYVKLEVDDSGNAVITSDVGNTYSSTPVVGVGISLVSTVNGCGLCFSASNGKLVDASYGSRDPAYVEEIELVSKRDASEKRSLTVNSSGMVSEQ